MNLRPFQAGDEFAQLKIYNTAAAHLAKFKPASIIDIQRRTKAKDFDAGTRFFAEDRGSVVGYCTWQANGRVGFPWCLPGHESVAEPLFARTLQALQQCGAPTAFAAYRKDWPAITGFFEKQGFRLAREMVNFVMKFENMPTPSARLGSSVTPAKIEDLPVILELGKGVIRCRDVAGLRAAIWDNPWFGNDSLFVKRNADGTPAAAGIFIVNNQYADPLAVDASMPCFRLGAFGTEGMTHKRIRGLFSFVTGPDRNVFTTGMDLLGHATNRLRDDDDIGCYAAQVPSDAATLFPFYERTFERQGSFPIYERAL